MLKKRFRGKCCRALLEKRVLKRSVVEKCWREPVEKSVGEKGCSEVL